MVALPCGGSADEPVASSVASPTVWVLHDGKPGRASQALGWPEATGLPFIEKPLAIRNPWAWLPPQLWVAPLRAAMAEGIPLRAPWPDLVIGCGRNTAMPALAIRRASRGRTLAVQIQDPRVGRDEFDMLVVPEHDRLRGERVIVTRGAIHRVTAPRLDAERRRFPALEGLPRPIIGALIGGSNPPYPLDFRPPGAIADAGAAAARPTRGPGVFDPAPRTRPAW